jgi:hypothetical protein
MIKDEINLYLQSISGIIDSKGTCIEQLISVVDPATVFNTVSLMRNVTGAETVALVLVASR